jgi:hypothetical protein
MMPETCHVKRALPFSIPLTTSLRVDYVQAGLPREIFEILQSVSYWSCCFSSCRSVVLTCKTACRKLERALLQHGVQ